MAKVVARKVEAVEVEAVEVEAVEVEINTIEQAKDFLTKFNEGIAIDKAKLIKQCNKEVKNHSKTTFANAIDAVGLLSQEVSRIDKVIKPSKDVIREIVLELENYPMLSNQGDRFVVSTRTTGLTLDEETLPKDHEYFILKSKLATLTEELIKKGHSKPRGVPALSFTPIVNGGK